MTKKLFLLTTLIINGLIAVMMFVAMKTALQNDFSDSTATKTSNIFFAMQLGQSGPIYSLILFTVITVFSSFILVYVKNNATFYNVVQRIGYRRFLQKGVLYSFFGGFCLSLLISFYQVTLLSYLVHPLQFTKKTQSLADGISVFDDGSLASIAQFSILSAIGWGVFSVFIFSVTLWIKKNALATVAGGLVGVVLFMVPVLLDQLLNGIFSFFFYSIQVSTLVAPGSVLYQTLPSQTATAYFPLSVLIYLLASLVLMKRWVKRKGNEHV